MIKVIVERINDGQLKQKDISLIQILNNGDEVASFKASRKTLDSLCKCIEATEGMWGCQRATREDN